MEKSSAVTIDFDELCRLYELDPEEFEKHRRQIIEEEISRRPPEVQERLRKFQWVLDMKRRRCKNALEACFMFHEMLMEHVYGENGLLKNLDRLIDAAKGVNVNSPVPVEVDTKVLKFNPPGPSKHASCG
ncbi:MAG: hypothetical protein DSZ23_04260 [Thermodesulfatator sp.]|nr:MAG: hypothetical protein DSZ23_04260 [Thermodesulfatator sp.]